MKKKTKKKKQDLLHRRKHHSFLGWPHHMNITDLLFYLCIHLPPLVETKTLLMPICINTIATESSLVFRCDYREYRRNNAASSDNLTYSIRTNDTTTKLDIKKCTYLSAVVTCIISGDIKFPR